jgi:hypothetical protein
MERGAESFRDDVNSVSYRAFAGTTAHLEIELDSPILASYSK